MTRDPDDEFDDPRALSITAAAADDGARPALIDDDGVLDVASAAAAMGDLPPAPAADGALHAQPLLAAPGRSTLLAIWAALERHTPLGLIHARAPEPERAALIARLAAAVVPTDTLAVVFTSGSTGRPKGVVLSRRAARAAAALSAAHLGWREDDRWLLALPLAHVGGLAIVIRCLVARRPLVVTASGLDPERLAATLDRHRVTLASLVPTQLDALLALPAWRPPPTLRAVLVGGAAAAPKLVARARARGVPVLTTYGMSETFGQVATASLADAVPPGAVGRALPGVTLIAGTVDAPGPIVVDTPTRMTGYLDEPSPPAGPLTTADLGFVADGWLRVVGRVDDVIVTGGENVHPVAVEAMLLTCPGVAGACVFGVPDPRWGQLVVAAVVTSTGFDRARTLAAAAARLPDHARPRRLIEVAALPLTATGKVDRRRAAADFGERALAKAL